MLKDFKSYSKAIKEYNKNPEKFRNKPKPPMPKKLKYLTNTTIEGNANIIQQNADTVKLKIKNGFFIKIKLPKDFIHRVSSVRLKLMCNDVYADIVYTEELPEVKVQGNYIAGIDIGLNEFLSVVSTNPNLKSFIVSGKEIKSFNQWFNKEHSKLISQIDSIQIFIKEQGDSITESQLNLYHLQLKQLLLKRKTLSAVRKRKIENDLHKISRKLVNLLYQTGHKAIYIGKNALESKNGINLGNKTNQHFVFIPMRKLIQMITYKAEKLGMRVKEIDESYTSKTSPFADIFTIKKLGDEKRKAKDKDLTFAIEEKQKQLMQGIRIGNLFKDKSANKLFHADLVGALNILRVGAKLLKPKFYDNFKTLFVKLCNPVKAKLIDFIYKVTPESLWIGSRTRQAFFKPVGWIKKLHQTALFAG